MLSINILFPTNIDIQSVFFVSLKWRNNLYIDGRKSSELGLNLFNPLFIQMFCQRKHLLLCLSFVTSLPYFVPLSERMTETRHYLNTLKRYMAFGNALFIILTFTYLRINTILLHFVRWLNNIFMFTSSFPFITLWNINATSGFLLWVYVIW